MGRKTLILYLYFTNNIQNDERIDFMFNFYEMQSVMEAKKMEMDFYIKEKSFSRHLKKNNRKFSILGWVKNTFSSKRDIIQNQPCCSQ